MANLSLRMRDDLKTKAQRLASEQGVSLNQFINATIAAARRIRILRRVLELFPRRRLNHLRLRQSAILLKAFCRCLGYNRLCNRQLGFLRGGRPLPTGRYRSR